MYTYIHACILSNYMTKQLLLLVSGCSNSENTPWIATNKTKVELDPQKTHFDLSFWSQFKNDIYFFEYCLHFYFKINLLQELNCKLYKVVISYQTLNYTMYNFFFNILKNIILCRITKSGSLNWKRQSRKKANCRKKINI